MVWMSTALAAAAVGFGQAPTPALQQADAAYRAGQAALSRHDLDAAQADFETVVKLSPTAEQGHSALGTVLLNRGRTQEGIRELEAALAIKQSDQTAQMNLALAYQQIGSSAKALPLFASLEQGARAARRPLPEQLLAAYARALTATGKLAQAGVQMRAAVQQQPNVAELHDELGSIDAQQKDWAGAQSEFAAAIRLDPGLALAHLHLGTVLQAQGQPEGLRELDQAAQLGSPAIQVEVGNAFAAAGHDEQAMPLFQKVLQQEPDSTAAMFGLALALQRANQLEEAIALLRKVVAAEPKNALAMTNLGLALSQSQQAKQAVPVLQRAVKLDPTSPTAHQNLAAAYVQLSQLGDAVAELRAALKLAPDSPQLHYDLGLALKMSDDTRAAVPELQTAERLDPAAPEASYALGMLYMQQAHYEDAARELNVSLKLRPDNGEGWATLGSVYGQLNMLPEGVAALREAIRQLPQQPDPHLTLAALLVKQNQPAEAAAERKTAAGLMRANMNRQRAEIATNAGDAALKSGDLASAAAQFHDALSYDANYPAAHLGLAKVFDSQGKAVDAAAERQKAGGFPVVP
jgi:protein O-GlcNAc transferase